MNTFDQLHRYLFNEANVRGELVRLDESLDKIVHNTEYPEPVQHLLAEMAAATTLLSATLKFTGEIGLQIQGEGAMKYAVINATHDHNMRGVARIDENAVEVPDSFSELVGNKAVLVITITPDEGERYQGMVALDKPSLAQCLEAYFEQSEQLATKVILMSELTQSAGMRAAGMLLQVLPTSAEATDINSHTEFEHLTKLAETLTGEEMFGLDVNDLLYRLYHQEQVELYPGQDVAFKCTCSAERSAAALRNVEKAELLDIVAEQGEITMNCQYCHATYRFDAIDVEAIHGGHYQTSNAPQ